MIYLKKITYFALKYSGIFHLCGFLTKNKLRILCYHGFSDSELVNFRPKLYIQPSVFEKRIDFLIKNRFTILSLNEAMQNLKNENFQNKSVCITVDDGFECFYERIFNLLEKNKIHVTLYITTYYSICRQPIFMLFFQYILWKSGPVTVDLSKFDFLNLDLILHFDLDYQYMETINNIKFIDNHCKRNDRMNFLLKLSVLLGVDLTHAINNKYFYIMSMSVLNFISNSGLVDVQMHTHRHNFPDEYDQSINELTENKNYISLISSGNIEHFCYPSGKWSKSHKKILRDFGVASATTCDCGFNSKSTNPFELKRILDSSTVSQIEFEAELWGVNEIWRSVKSLALRQIKRI